MNSQEADGSPDPVFCFPVPFSPNYQYSRILKLNTKKERNKENGSNLSSTVWILLDSFCLKPNASALDGADVHPFPWLKECPNHQYSICICCET